MTRRTNNYINTTVYDQEYFSDSQVNLYIGDVLIDEIIGLNFRHIQNKVPVYGYASKLFGKTMNGTAIVQGEFTINFKEAGYLITVLKRLNSLKNSLGTSLISPFVSSKNIGRPKVGGARNGGHIGVLQRANIERVLNGESSPGTPARKEDLIRYYQDLTSMHTELSGFNNEQGALNQAEQTFEEFENKVWGDQSLETEPRTIDDNDFDDFTIYVTYGDFNGSDRLNHTVRRIDGVRIISTSQNINRDGRPVSEVCRFIAKNLV